MTITDEGPRPDRVEAVEVILKIGAEGGSLTMVGMRAANGCRFRLVRNESVLRELLNAEDRVGLQFWQQSDWVESLEGALTLLDRYPWHLLSSLQVHPDFRQQVWAAVEERHRTDDRSGSDRPDRWHRLCHRRQTDRLHRPLLLATRVAAACLGSGSFQACK
jgi:hypothetical protein